MFNVFHERQPLRKSHIIISHRRTSLKVFISSNIQLASSHRPPTLLPSLCTHTFQAFCHVGVFVFTTGDGQVSLHCYFVSHVFSRECVYFCFVYRLLTFTRVLFFPIYCTVSKLQPLLRLASHFHLAFFVGEGAGPFCFKDRGLANGMH